ncbi:hypothetical protein, partial [Vibrio jasicida]|uniref:hypothetical protein n=1 Tax=Vibrio jasicida TaxID=766224 RepID=UPI001CA4AF6E
MFPDKVCNKSIEIKQIVNVLGYCIPLAFANILVMFLPLMERTLIEQQLSLNELAQYVFNFEIASKFTTVFLLCLKLIVWPNIVDSNNSKEKYKYKKYGAILMLLLVVNLILLIFFG